MSRLRVIVEPAGPFRERLLSILGFGPERIVTTVDLDIPADGTITRPATAVVTEIIGEDKVQKVRELLMTGLWRQKPGEEVARG